MKDRLISPHPDVIKGIEKELVLSDFKDFRVLGVGPNSEVESL